MSGGDQVKLTAALGGTRVEAAMHKLLAAGAVRVHPDRDPIADALHVVHGTIGCASYTWDIRGALSSA